MKELIEIQQALKAPKGKENSFQGFNYRSAEDILDKLKPLLEERNALVLTTDEVKAVNDSLFIETTAIFQVGDKSFTVKAQAGINLTRKGMDASQAYGSASSYAKKYALGNMFLIDNTKDADTKDNSEENKPSSKKELEDAKEGLKAAFKDGELNKAYFGLSKIQQTELRDFANELKRSSKR